MAVDSRLETSTAHWCCSPQADLLAKDFRANCAKIFDLIDEDGSGTLSLPEIMLALKGKPDVLRFIKTCRNPVLSEFLVPPRVQAAMKECDTNDDGELDREEWKALSDRSLAVWKSISASGAPDNSSLSHFSAMTRPCWLHREVRNEHHYAIDGVGDDATIQHERAVKF